MYIKVDFSRKRKSSQWKADMPGEYALYTKKHWWQRWTEARTYSCLDWALSDAKRLREVQLPRKF